MASSLTAIPPIILKLSHLILIILMCSAASSVHGGGGSHGGGITPACVPSVQMSSAEANQKERGHNMIQFLSTTPTKNSGMVSKMYLNLGVIPKVFINPRGISSLLHFICSSFLFFGTEKVSAFWSKSEVNSRQ